jgi:Bacteriophage baseplate protein W
MNLAYPYRIDDRGRTAETPTERHVRDLIEQVLFTAPGERVMQPELGSGIAQLVFAPNSGELASAAQMLVQGALQRWLGDLIVVNGVGVEAADGTLSVSVHYTVRVTGRSQVALFPMPAEGVP